MNDINKIEPKKQFIAAPYSLSSTSRERHPEKQIRIQHKMKIIENLPISDL